MRCVCMCVLRVTTHALTCCAQHTNHTHTNHTHVNHTHVNHTHTNHTHANHMYTHQPHTHQPHTHTHTHTHTRQPGSRPKFLNPCPPSPDDQADEVTSLSVIANTAFMSSATEHTRAVYQEMVVRAARKLGPEFMLLDMDDTNKGLVRCASGV